MQGGYYNQPGMGMDPRMMPGGGMMTPMPNGMAQMAQMGQMGGMGQMGMQAMPGMNAMGGMGMGMMGPQAGMGMLGPQAGIGMMNYGNAWRNLVRPFAESLSGECGSQLSVRRA